MRRSVLAGTIWCGAHGGLTLYCGRRSVMVPTTDLGQPCELDELTLASSSVMTIRI
ncbi:hypothetical protein CC85DRAFT_287612 [Cutaneotrichosporon oleaginosum]|uniref:Uncharacterized protein n=1 Tax=Cutaneotrichosporon oleaginosum TaxID=879819 RepID=A0A0J0XGV4_9TREE|nr:uncharacterized protein CC85DRAFT_287612 [Cutaneotrichosporon oleaginosum]KLT40293.1 hypothetical protein CC85DRAFT_287612 [Cutaneotrichosporon oleaginosum]TXT07994.1 hypothetical protein COLE_04918 [Cutaneotrichosporon oleaginosum]